MKNKKRLLLCLCCALMISAVPMATSCMGLLEEESSSPSTSVEESSGAEVGTFEGGEYYAGGAGEAATGANTLSLTSDGAITLKIGGTTLTGTYTYKNNTFTITFSDKTTATAQGKNGAIVLTYDDVTYTFLEKIDYTVSFSVKGTVVAAQTVVNGRFLSAPNDPQSQGQVFVGWYTDKEFKNSFAFNTTPITSNVTLYARFVDAVEQEYTVRFMVDGEEAYDAVKTVGGVVAQLPTPAKENATFVGWWIGDEDGKFIAKYEGQVLNENTTLFAMWDDGSPIVSVTETGASWEAKGVNNSYSVKITAPDGTVAEEGTTSMASYAYDFASQAPGEYKIEVTLNGKTGVAYYKNKYLAKVSIFQVVDSKLTFVGVPNATGYLIMSSCGSASHVHTEYNNGASTVYDFSECEMKEGGITFVVKAVADGWMASESEVYTVERNLTATTVSIDAANEKATWTAVENATGYEVSVNGTAVATVDASVTSYDLRNYAPGELTVQVTAKAHGYNAASAEAVYNKTSLLVPANVKLVGSTLTWDAVANAAGYKVMVGGVEYTATTNEFALKSEYLDASATSCDIQVKAVGATAEQDSVYGDTVTVQFGSMSKNVAYKSGAVTWDPVLNAKGYEVMLGGQIVPVEATENSCAVSFVSGGTHIIQVRCIKADGEKSDWVETYVDVYETAFEVDGGKEVDSVYAAAGDKVTLSESAKAGYEFSGWFNTPNGVNGTQYTEIVQGAENMTVYAHWEAKTYKANLNAGIGTLENASIDVTFDSHYTLPRPVTTSEDKFFGGWYTEENGRGIKYTNDAGASRNIWRDTQNVTLYAYWMEDVLNYLEVDDEENGGTGYEVYGGKNVGQLSVVRIPETYNGKTVISIGASAFANGFTGYDNITKIEMPDTIQTIFRGTGSSRTADSFYSCDNLTEFEVYETAGGHDRHYEDIDGVLVRNYQGRKELVYVTKGYEGATFEIPESVNFIPDYLFTSSLYRKVIVPVSVTEIAAHAFEDAYKMEEIEFVAPETDLAEDGSNGLILRESAFYTCPALGDVTLPARTAQLPASIATDESVPVTFALVFGNCSGIQNVHVAAPTTEGACYYTSQDGMILSKDGTELIFCIKNRKADVVIPASVSTIGESAFYGCSAIRSVEIHAFVTSIEASAFEECNSMTSLTFQGTASDAAINIASRAFYKCSGITNVTLPANLGTLSAYAFGGCGALTNVTVNVGASAVIEDAAFGTEASSPYFYVTTVHIGVNAPVMNVAAVFGAETLINLSVDQANPNYTTDENGILYNKEVVEIDGEMKEVPTEILFYPLGLVLENYEMPSTITTIGAEVFTGRTFKNITIGKNVTSIGANAFADCKYLETVTFEEVNAALTETNGLEIAANAFKNCERLANITLPVRLKKIGDTVFSGCDALAKITVPANVTTIGKQAFNDCGQLTEIELLGTATTFTLESSKFTATNYCKALTKIIVPADHTSYVTEKGVLYTKAGGVATELIYCPSMCIGEVATIDGVATNVLYVPNTVNKVYANAFLHAMAVESVVFLENAESPVKLTLAASAFAADNDKYPSSLKSVALPKGMTDIAASAFENGTIEEITIPNTVTNIGNKAFKSCENLTTVYFEEGGTAALKLATASSSTSNGAFYGCTSLTSVNLPERLSYIGAGSFYNTGVVNITIPSTVTQIWNGAFQSCENLATVTITDTAELPSQLVNIKGAAFRGSSISAINFPANVTEIAGGSFAETQLVNVTLPAKLSTLSDTFKGITTLKSITFADDNKITAIPNQAFSGCSALETITIPSNVKTIGNRAFLDCSSLKSVVFETNDQGKTALTKIDNQAFAGTALEEFILPETSASSLTFSYSMFSGCEKLTKVQLPKQVTAVAETFMGCHSITELSFPDNANLYYEDGIIYNNQTDKTSILYVMKDVATENLVIPDGVKTIGDSAFANQPSIKTVSLPASISNLSTSAFENCYNLTTVTFRKDDNVAESLKTIGSSTFSGCRSLTEIIGLPDTVTSIATYAFQDCVKLSKINSDEEGTVNLPESLTTLGGGATSNSRTFANCASIKKVTIPAGVKVISAEVFDTCIGLEEVVFAEGSQVTTLGNRAFEDCWSLKTFTMPDTITTLNYGVFTNCTSLESVHVSTKLSKMQAQTFMGCTALKSIELPETLTVLEYSMFEDCTSLGAWDEEAQAYGKVVLPSTLVQMQHNVFKNCTSLTEIAIPDGVTYFSNSTYAFSTSRNSSIFMGCTALKTVDLGSVAKIGQYAFSGCTSLENIDLSKVTDMNTYAFEGCTSLRSVNLSELKVPMGYEFQGCTNLESVTFGSALTKISSYMFQGCTKLASIEIPSSVTGTGLNTYAFADCTSLTEMTIPSQITKIPGGLFAGCTNLETINIEGKITQIGEFAFSGCAKITEFAIPSTLTAALGNRIFEGTSITSLTIPKAYAKLWSSRCAPFAGCETLTEILVADGNPIFKSVDGILYDAVDNNIVAVPNGKKFENDTFIIPEGVGLGKRTVPFGGCSIKTVVLPESMTTFAQDTFTESLVEEVVLGSQFTHIDDYAFYDAIALKRILKKDANGVAQSSLAGVDTIDSYAFYNTVSFESIVLPDELTVIASSLFRGSGIKSITFGAGITAIPANAFDGSGLTSVDLPANITSVGNYAFANCAALTDVRVSATATWGQYAFQNCTSLKNVTIEEGVAAISNYMFQGCSSLTEITLPESIASIGSYAFAGTGLTELEVPAAVASIGAYVFDGAPLASITLKEGLTTISNSAFAGTSLKSVTIPSTVTSIGSLAFAGCTELETVVINNANISIGDNAFEGCTSIKSIVIPANASVGDNVFAGWTSAQTIYVTLSEYEAVCKWGTTWNDTDAKIVYSYVQE